METDQYHQSQALQLTVSKNEFFAVQALQYNSITVSKSKNKAAVSMTFRMRSTIHQKNSCSYKIFALFPYLKMSYQQNNYFCNLITSNDNTQKRYNKKGER